MVSNPSKILFVNHSSRPAGAEFVLRDIAQVFPNSAVFLFEEGVFRSLLEEQNTRVIVARGSSDMTSIKRDSNLIKSAVPLIGSMTSLTWQIAKASKEFDYVYANSQKAFILAAAASYISRKPLIWHCHDILTPEHFNKRQIQLDVTLANRRTSQVIVPSVATAVAFQEAGGNINLAKVLYNGISSLPGDGMPVSKEVLRQKLGLPAGELYGVFSRLAKWKGQHIAIEALRYLPQTQCVIVGDAQFGEDDYAASLRETAKNIGVLDRVVFTGHRTDVAEIMKAVDVYCHPSIAPEPFSLAILEAMRAGLPIAASNTGGIPEVINNGVTGLLAVAGNAKSIALAIGKFLNDKQLGIRTGNAAKTLVEKEYTIEIMQRNIDAIINRIKKQ